MLDGHLLETITSLPGAVPYFGAIDQNLRADLSLFPERNSINEVTADLSPFLF